MSRFDLLNRSSKVPVRVSVRRVIAQNPSVVSWVEMKVDEGQIEADDIAFSILPDFLANQPVSSGTANERSFIGDLDGFLDRPSHCGHVKEYSTGRIVYISPGIDMPLTKANSANPVRIRAVVVYTLKS
jgi:hypothetical protein